MTLLQSDTEPPISLFDTSLLDRLLVFEAEDLGEVQRYVSSVFCPHRLLSGKRKLQFHHYSALMRELGFNYLSYGHLDCPIDMDAPNLGGSYMIRMTISGLCELRIKRQSILLKPGAIIVVNPDGPVRTRMQGDYKHLTIKVPHAVFHQVLAMELGYMPVEPLEFDNKPLYMNNNLAGVVGIIRMICDDLNSSLGSLAHGRVSKHIERALLCSLISLMPNNYSLRLNGNGRLVMPYYLRAVIRYIERNVRTPITLAEMVEVSGVSTRSLHASFRKFLNTTPMAYLKNYRLDLAREELETAAHDGRSVTDVAFDCGFSHLSQFARDFRQRFDILPSQVRFGLSESVPRVSLTDIV